VGEKVKNCNNYSLVRSNEGRAGYFCTAEGKLSLREIDSLQTAKASGLAAREKKQKRTLAMNNAVSSPNTSRPNVGEPLTLRPHPYTPVTASSNKMFSFRVKFYTLHCIFIFKLPQQRAIGGTVTTKANNQKQVTQKAR